MEESLEISVFVEAIAMMTQYLVTCGVSSLEVMFWISDSEFDVVFSCFKVKYYIFH